MTTKRSIYRVTSIALAVGTFAWPSSATAIDGTSADKATQASCIVTITPGSSATPINPETVEQIVNSVGVAGKAVRETLGIAKPADGVLLDIGFDAIDSAFEPEFLELLGAPISGRLYVEYYADDAAEYRVGAEELLAAVTARLSKVLEQHATAQHAILQQHLSVAGHEVDQAKEQLAALQAKANVLREKAGRSDLSRDAVMEEVHELEAALRECELDLTTHRARSEAISAQIAKLGEQVKKSPGADEITRALHQVVELREMNVQATRNHFEIGQVSISELKQAEVELAMAQAEVARHLEEMADAAGGGALGELNQQLTHLSISAVELEARRNALKVRLEQIRAARLLDLADEYERDIRVQREVAEDVLEEALQRHAAAQRVMRSFQPPNIVIVGGQ